MSYTPFASQDEADRAWLVASSIAIHGAPIAVENMESWLAYKAFHGPGMTLRNLYATKP